MHVVIRIFLLIVIVIFNNTEANAKLEVRGNSKEKSMLYVNNQPILPFCFEPWANNLSDNSTDKIINLSECLQHANIWKKSYSPITKKNHQISNFQSVYWYDNGTYHMAPFVGDKGEWEFLQKEKYGIEDNRETYSYHVITVKDQKKVMIELSYNGGGSIGTVSQYIEIKVNEKQNTITGHDFYAGSGSNYNPFNFYCINKPNYFNGKVWAKRSMAIADLVNLLQDRDVARHKETEPDKYYVSCLDEKAGEIVEIDRSLSQLSFDKKWLKSGNEGNPDWETCLKNYVLNQHKKGKSLIVKAKNFEQFKQDYQRACPVVK